MEIPEIHMISDFEAGLNCLHNPSLIARFIPFPGQQVFVFWKWGALIFAIFATFTSIIRRGKLVLIHFHVLKASSLHKEDKIVEFNEDDEVSLASSSDDERKEQENRATTSSRGQHRVDEDFRVKNSPLFLKSQWQNGQMRQRRRRRRTDCTAWSEFISGKNVVKFCDSLGFRLAFDEDLFKFDPQSVVTTWESDQFQKESKLPPGGAWITAAAAPTVFLTADGNGKTDRVILSGYDSRMRRHVPALYAEWSSPAEKLGAVSTSGVSKVYLRDDVSGVLTVGDVRNVRRPLESVRESDDDTWWVADAVGVDERFEESE